MGCVKHAWTGRLLGCICNLTTCVNGEKCARGAHIVMFEGRPRAWKQKGWLPLGQQALGCVSLVTPLAVHGPHNRDLHMHDSSHYSVTY
jgi:hypothetical protein